MITTWKSIGFVKLIELQRFQVTFTYDPVEIKPAVVDEEEGAEAPAEVQVEDNKTVANVVQADIEASNGVIHAIDKVLV